MINRFVNDLEAPPDVPPIAMGLCPVAWLPGILAALQGRKSAWLYEDQEAAITAHKIISEVQMSFLIDAYKGLVEPQQQIYRLLDSTLNGVEYFADELNGEIIITPTIPAVPDIPAAPLIPETNRIARLVGLGLIGNPDANPVLGSEGAVEILQQIRDNIVADDVNLDEIVSNLGQVLALLA